MHYQERFYRGDTLGTEIGSLSAETYNNMRQLISRHDAPQVFVPVRSLQYMAVVSDGEVVFVDIHIQRVTELSWSNFQANARGGLDCPVSYSCAWHNNKAHERMQKITLEFAESLKVLLTKLRNKDEQQTATLLRFPLAS